ncbi:sushi, von Willebrand factor type A, EGF and pentraxin domain-containing protein 1 [Triplophysa rosa]|uniref:Sushi n=1 Tax=Triplophysa rosa TaxID=992332 RepID=A0A9W7WE67_TRIRA|nr:sushi, von Willebrand factor type A, EGF and pentraxin domain-containing protein 1 [Triplophysa rosa]KAI7794538.1 putative sushi [Triplophysa rosa]
MANVWGNILVLVFAHFVGSEGNQCGEPTEYPDRRLDDKYRHMSDFKPDDSVEYNCAPGYRRTDGSRMSFCEEGRWTPLDLTCEKMSSSHGTNRRFSRQVRVSSKHATCSRPLVGNYGTVNDLKSNFKHGEQVSITCRTGFNGSGLYRCVHNTWHPRKPKCDWVKCPVIEIINGHIKNRRVRYNTIVDIHCKPGFNLRGAQRLQCGVNGSWMPDVPTCEPVSGVTCSSPAVAHGGIKSGAKPYYKLGDTVTIRCSEGFGLIGSSQITCGQYGKWQRLPECRPEVRCSALLMMNGKIQSGEKPHYKPRDTVTVSCTEGYDLIGSPQVTCGPDGQWQRLPECRPEVKCSAPVMMNGKIQSGEKPHYKPRDTVTVSCTEGYDLIGSSQVTCGPDGQWQRLPECRFKVSPTGNCGPAPFYPHAHLRDEYSPEQKEHTAEARLRYKCTIGHRWAGGKDSIYCRNGEWTDLQMRCEPKRCGSAGEISNGHIEYSGVSFGDTATVVCDEGYEGIGRPVRYCRDGGWDGRNAECEPVYCPPPPLVNNADMFDLTYDQVPFGNMVSYRCRTGTLIGAREMHCTKNGTWSAPPPECRDIVCPVPRVPHGSGMMGYRSVYRFGDTVRITCNPGFRLSEENYVKCGIDGEWTPDLSKLCLASRVAY